LQALGKLKLQTKLIVVDKSEDALKKACSDFEDIYNNTQHIDYLQDIQSLPKNLDLCIIATTADVRKDVIVELTNNKNVQFLILEKILFQKIKHYRLVKDILIQNNIDAWVNCAMRAWPVYRHIKNILDDEKILQINISGSNWGMGTSLIHYIDLIMHLSDSIDYKIQNIDLNKEFQNSKRKGSIEFTGTIIGKTANETIFTISSYQYGNFPAKIEIFSESKEIIVHERKAIIEISCESNNWEKEIVQLEFKYVSQLTNVIVENILENGNCVLPTFSDSSVIHIQMIKSLISYYNLVTKQELDYIPIT